MFELDDRMQFEFECDLMINSDLIAVFDDSTVTQVTDLLKEHGIDFVIKVGDCIANCGKAIKVVNIQTNSPINELFHYDLTSLMLTVK